MANKNVKTNQKPVQSGKPQGKRQQPRKDSSSKRVNFDNTRESKFEKDVQEERHSRKGYDKPMEAKKTSGGSSNDPSWYAANDKLLTAAASLPFTDAVGDRLNPYAKHAFPGVFVMSWVPNIDGDAVNQSANSHYSFTVHANSRNYEYDAPDQMMLILAGAQLFTALAMGIRAYGVMRNYDQLDRYTPAALVTAMGFQYEDLKVNLSNMWFDLNEMISRSAQIWIPKDMPVIDRWFWMSSHIYRDATSAKAQYYMYVPKQILVMSETASATGTSLLDAGWDPQNPVTWAQYRNLMDKLFTSLLQSQDRGMIFGDILAAYGAERIFAISGIDSEYKVAPVNDPEVLTQFENSVTCPALTLGVYQTESKTIYSQYALQPLADVQSAYTPCEAVLNFHQAEAPTAAQIMVATRMMALGWQVTTPSTGGDAPQVAFKPQTAGTEYAFDYTIYHNSYDPASYIPVLGKIRYNSVKSAPYPPAELQPLYDQVWFAFDWVPFRYYFNTTDIAEGSNVQPIDWSVLNSLGSAYPSNEIGDIDMYTHISISVLRKMHTTAIYSEFGVPTLL